AAPTSAPPLLNWCTGSIRSGGARAVTVRRRRRRDEGRPTGEPHDPDEIADGLHMALTMPAEERRERWQRMIEPVRRNTAASWARGFLAELEGRPAKAAKPTAT